MIRLAEPRAPGRTRLYALIALAGLLACSDDRRLAEKAAAPAPAQPTAVPKVVVTPDRAAAADVVIRQGRIFTGDSARPWVLAVAAKDGRIVAIGSNRDVKPFIGEGTRVFDLDLHFVMTGIVEPQGATPASPGADPDLSPQHAWKEIEAKAVAAHAALEEATAKAASGASPGPTPVAGSDLMAELLRAWTIDNARATGRESEVGSLAIGKRADILILDRHPYFTPADTLGETRAVVIVSGGKVIRDELAARPRG